MDKDNTANSEGTKKRLANLKPFKKGQSGNPSGRPNYTEQLKKAIKVVEKDKGKELFIRFVEQAWTNPTIMVALMKKVMPDMNQSDVKITSPFEEYENLPDEELLGKVNDIINRKRSGSINTIHS